jgi:hypothetical protein
MNNYFNFEIPYLNSQFGTDWDDFITIIDDNTDYFYSKIEQLYWLKDITRMPLMAMELALKLRNISHLSDEVMASKKLKLRKFNTTSKNKGTSDVYLDFQEALVGTRGVVYNGFILGSIAWGVSAWAISGSPESTDRIWATPATGFDIYVDVKTTDTDILDQITEIYRQKFLLPAFYQVYLVDSSFNILRTV